MSMRFKELAEIRRDSARALLLAIVIGVFISGCKGSAGGGQLIASIQLPTGNTLNLFCIDVGINNETCVLDDPDNPFARSLVDDSNKFQLYDSSPSAKTDFYIWATALARSPTGENQYYTALSLHEVFTQGGSELARAQAIRAYRSLLENFFESVTFFLGSPRLDFIPDTDFFFSDGGSGTAAAGFDGAFTGDPDFSPIWFLPAGNGFGAPTAALSFDGFSDGFANNYQNLVFNVKDLPTGSVFVVFVGNGAFQEVEFDLATFGEDIPGTTGWKRVTVPLSSFSQLPLYTGFSINSGFGNGGTFLLTEIGFTGDATGNGLVQDTDGNGIVYLYRSGTELFSVNLRDLVGQHLHDPANQNLRQLFINQADAINELASWGFQFNPVDNTLSVLP